MSTVLQIFLVVCYGAAWVIASSRPITGLLYLALFGTVLSIPTIFKNVLIGSLIMGFLTALVAMFPCLAPLLAIWFVIRILAKLEELRRNFVLLVLSFALYGVLLSVPLNIRTNMLSSVINANSTTLADIIMFVMGALIMQMTCYAFAKLGHRRNMTKTAAFIIGLPGFLVLLAIFLFGLHSGPGSVDGSDNNG